MTPFVAAKYCAYPMAALALALSSVEVQAQQTTPPPPLPEGSQPSFGIGQNVQPGGQWVWQQSIYGGGHGYWAFIKPWNARQYPGFHTPSQ